MNKPNTRVIDYASLVQDGILAVDDVPQDIKQDVIKWVRYFAGIKGTDVVKDTESQPSQPTKADVPAVEKKVTDNVAK